jgi:hypothetical protein
MSRRNQIGRRNFTAPRASPTRSLCNAQKPRGGALVRRLGRAICKLNIVLTSARPPRPLSEPSQSPHLARRS